MSCRRLITSFIPGSAPFRRLCCCGLPGSAMTASDDPLVGETVSTSVAGSSVEARVWVILRFVAVGFFVNLRILCWRMIDPVLLAEPKVVLLKPPP